MNLNGNIRICTLFCGVALSTVLVGCADQPIQDAPIEDRNAIKTAPQVDAKATPFAATQPGGVAGVEAKPLTSTSSAPDKGLKTTPLADATTEVKPLDGTAAASSTAPLAASTGGAGASANGPAISLNLKDPNSPLAKRVILFDYDSAAIRDEYRETLEAHAEYLKQNAASKAILQGHADERGSREYNLALGQRRAESVYKAMSLLGVPEAQIEAVSLGEEKPVDEGHDEAAWTKNRRSEILYHGE